MKISIITVCLNSELTIEQTIQSVLSQKNENIEYIIVDGKSTDRTAEIINKYRSLIDIVISEPDEGIYDAMNKGISLASGDVIGIINSDDWYEPEALNKVEMCFYDSDAEIVYGNLNLVSENGDVKLLIPGNIKKLRYEMEVPHPTAFVKKSVYEKYGYFSVEYKIAADYDLMLRFYIKGVRFVYLDELLANFRMTGISVQQSRNCAYETISISEKYLSYYLPEERKYIKRKIDDIWKSFYFRQLLDSFPTILLDHIKKRQVEEKKENIALFGAGRWGQDLYHLLAEADLVPLFLIDNKKDLWEKTKEGRKISPPDVLGSFDGILLILAKGFSKEIMLQVKEMNNSVMVCITWEELVDELKDHIFS